MQHQEIPQICVWINDVFTNTSGIIKFYDIRLTDKISLQLQILSSSTNICGTPVHVAVSHVAHNSSVIKKCNNSIIMQNSARHKCTSCYYYAIKYKCCSKCSVSNKPFFPGKIPHISLMAVKFCNILKSSQASAVDSKKNTVIMTGVKIIQ